MGALKVVALALAMLAASPAGAQTVDTWQPYVAEASRRFGIPQAWIRRVMAIESRGRTVLNGKPIRSPKGAMGLMQLMPGTWAEMRAAYGLGNDPDEPRDNILAGTGYLRLMYDRYGYPGLFAAYNAGPGRYENYLAGRPLPDETRRYVTGLDHRTALPPASTSVLPRSLFAISQRSGDPQSSAATAAPPSGLIVLRGTGGD